MSDIPPLPDTDDPFELLGVPRGIDEVGLKRAFVKLLKVYRPDRDPVSFQRIQEAYEQAQALLVSDTWDLEFELPRSTDDADRSAVADDVGQAIATAWTRLRDGDRDGAREALAQCQEANPSAAVVAGHRMLLDEVLDEPPEVSRSHLLRALEMGAPVAHWMANVYTPQELRALAQEEALLWTRLRKLDDRISALRLLRARWHGMLLNEQASRVVEEIDDKTFADDALTDEPLGMLVREVSAVIAWDLPDDAQRLLALYAGDAIEAMWVDYDAIVDLVAPIAKYTDIGDKLHRTPELEHHLKFHAILDDEELLPIARALGVAMATDPEPHLEALDALASHAPALVGQYIGSIEAAGPGAPEVDGQRTRAIDGAMWDAERYLKRHTGYQTRMTIFGLALLCSLGSFFLVGWWGVAVVLGVFVIAVWTFASYSSKFYAANLRPMIGALVAEQVVPPIDLARWIKRHKSAIENLDSFDTDIEHDFVLDALYWTARLRYMGVDDDETSG